MYTFGGGQYGQLGHGTFLFQLDVPKPLEQFWYSGVNHVTCGENHTALLTSMQCVHQFSLSPVQCQSMFPLNCVSSTVIESGLLYTFGDGRHGKLGLEEENFMNCFSPTLSICSLKYNVEFVSKITERDVQASSS